MGSKHLGADINLAWPTAQIAVMGAQGAVNILYRRELAASEDPEAPRAEFVTGVRGHLANPYIAAERGYVDAVDRAVADPLARDPRRCAMLRNKRETPAAEEAREHPAVMAAGETDGSPCPPSTAHHSARRHARRRLAALRAVLTAGARGRAPTVARDQCLGGAGAAATAAGSTSPGSWQRSGWTQATRTRRTGSPVPRCQSGATGPLDSLARTERLNRMHRQTGERTCTRS